MIHNTLCTLDHFATKNLQLLEHEVKSLSLVYPTQAQHITIQHIIREGPMTFIF